MRCFVTQDADKSAGISDFLDFLRQNGFAAHFTTARFNATDTNISVILMCRQPHHKFFQRIRYSKKDNTLYLDLMLQLKEIAQLTPEQRILVIARKMLEEIPQILARYDKLNFSVLNFSTELRAWFECHGVGVDDFRTLIDEPH